MSQDEPDKQSNEGFGLKPGGIVGLFGVVKRKLKVHTIEPNFQAVNDVKKGEQSKAAIAEKYGVLRITLSKWLQNVDEINDAYEINYVWPKAIVRW